MGFEHISAPLYLDKVDGVITEEYFRQWQDNIRTEQAEIMAKIKAFEKADDKFIDLGINTLELAEKATEVYFKSTPHEKAKFLKILLSNCILKDGKISVEWREPFNLLVSANMSERSENPENTPSDPEKINWLQRYNEVRTYFSRNPGELIELESSLERLLAA